MQSSKALEADLRRLVADQLGVDAADLTPDVSLTDDLAADSLDLVELGLVLEGVWPVTVRAERVAEVRTYGELRDLVVAAAQRAAPPTPDAAVVARVVWPNERRGPERVGALTPYTVQLLGDDARRAGPSARLEVDVPSAMNDASLAAARTQLAPLVARGVEVAIRRARALGRAAAGPLLGYAPSTRARKSTARRATSSRS
jgi:acyl carrier protein